MGRLVAMATVTGLIDRVGAVTKRPPIWALVAGALVGSGNRRGRNAAARGAAGYAIAAVLANLVIKPVVRRKRPSGSSEHARIGPVTSSFPSGHAATDLAFIFGVAMEIPVLFIPLSAATAAAHWSLIRSRAHHVSDVLAGGALGIGVAVGLRAAWPGGPPSPGDTDATEERLLTEVDGEVARLAVHIQPLDGPGPGPRSADGPAQRPDGHGGRVEGR